MGIIWNISARTREKGVISIEKITEQYQLYQGDCLEVMDKLIEAGVKVDCVITDPPYGTTACAWDQIIPFNEMWKRLSQLIKPDGAILLFGSEPFSSALRMSNLKQFKYDWVWNKKKPGNIMLAKHQPMKITEIISVFSKNKHNYYPIMELRDKVKKTRCYSVGDVMGGKVIDTSLKTYDKKYPKNLLEFSNANQKGKVHPTQKPVALLEYLIKTYTNEGEVVLDFTMGSGSTGVAALNTNRKFIGIELENTYYEVAKQRIEETIK